jgi:hypothetical protein
VAIPTALSRLADIVITRPFKTEKKKFWKEPVAYSPNFKTLKTQKDRGRGAE